MIITCPSCSARYRVGDDMIQAKGKRIKCKKCEAVFVAYPDRDAVLESKAPLAAAASPQPTPAAAAPQPPRPVAPTVAPVASAVPVAPPAPSAQPAATMGSQATVKVDRSNLDKFLQQAGSLDGTQSTLKVDPEQFKSYLQAQQAPGATVQVDRSQIDAFLHESAKGGGSEPPSSGPSASETVAMDSRALSSALGLTPPGSAPRPAPPANDFVPPTPSLSGFGGAPSGSFDQVDDPPFPSDEELGLANEFSVEMPSPIVKPAPVAPAPAPAPPKVEPAPAPVAAKPSAYAEERLFQADVEGKIYPNLSLDAIGRWVREGRLLEQDLIAPNGSSDYHAAETYSEFRTFFDELNASQEVEPVKKKGFFARLFSFGKK